MLGYLQETICPDIVTETHKCERFKNDPQLSHERAVKRIGRYILDTRDKGMVYRPGTLQGLEFYVDADFAGGWKYGDHDSP